MTALCALFAKLPPWFAAVIVLVLLFGGFAVTWHLADRLDRFERGPMVITFGDSRGAHAKHVTPPQQVK